MPKDHTMVAMHYVRKLLQSHPQTLDELILLQVLTKVPIFDAAEETRKYINCSIINNYLLKAEVSPHFWARDERGEGDWTWAESVSYVVMLIVCRKCRCSFSNTRCVLLSMR